MDVDMESSSGETGEIRAIPAETWQIIWIHCRPSFGFRQSRLWTWVVHSAEYEAGRLVLESAGYNFEGVGQRYAEEPGATWVA